MINQDLVRRAGKSALDLQLILRELYIQSGGEEDDPEQLKRDAKMTMTGLMRGVHDFINYCKSGE